MRVVWLGCYLTLSGCFLTGYELHQLEEVDAGAPGEAGPLAVEDAQAPQDATGLVDTSHGAPEAGLALYKDAGLASDAEVDADLDAAFDGGAKADGGNLADADVDANDMTVNEASVPDPDAGGSSDAGVDATRAADANVDASPTNQDAGLIIDAGDAAVSDAGGDAGCGIYGCVVEQSCLTGSSCDLTCNEVPDPGTTPTLDCQYDCVSATHCATSCSSNNTCLTNCTLGTCSTSCPLYAVCTTSCVSATCSGVCNAGSNCSFNCTTSTCSNITCAFGAVCRVHCLLGTGTCGFAYCGSFLQQSCPDGSIVCGQSC